MNPDYPVYIVSKGRWKSRFTSKALEKMKVPYHIVVEPQEYDDYASVIDPVKILTLPFSNIDQGSIPARNWIWEHSLGLGARRHWILDDNIRLFYRLNRNSKHPFSSGTVFKMVEDFVERYKNIALAGLEYEMFAPRKSKHPPYRLNTRIYSCILIKNDLPYRWRGKYNEDTDLSLRALKDGWCTILFMAFLADKVATMRMRGGNTDELYQGEGRKVMAEALQKQHPDVTRITWKWGRWQHYVDYGRFKYNKLIRRPGVTIPEGINEYGLKLKPIKAWVPQEMREEFFSDEEIV